ncbi:MAG: hypothetical protein MJ208_02115 [Bacilli bacterium]|nr:hypothetical protein [Bacilli bacterium]
MPKFSKESEFKHHKKYRWIALFFKLIAGPIFTFVFQGLTMPIQTSPSESQTLGTFLSTTLTLVVYYGIIFALNRYRNFRCHTSLKKSLAVYILVVINLMAIEATFSGSIQNILYSLTHIGLVEGQTVISITTVKSPLAYLGIGFLVHFLFGYVTGILLYLLFKNVLSNKDKLARI